MTVIASLLLAALLGVALVEVLAKRPVVAAGLVMGSVVESAFFQDVLGNPTFGGYSITVGDVIFTPILVAAVARMLRMTKFTTAHRVLILVAFLVALSLIRGVSTIGFETPVREARHVLYFYSGALYFSTVSFEQSRHKIAKVWLIATVALLVIVLFRWGVLLAGLPPTGVLTRSREVGGVRVIDNRNTLVIVHALFMIVPLWAKGVATRFERRLLFVAVPVLILLQHRTIWLVIALGVLVIVARSGIGSRAVDALLIAVFVAVGVVAMAMMSSQESTVVERAPADSETLEWRYRSWAELVAMERSTFDRLAGEPFGSGYERRVWTATVDTSPHNFYVELLVRVGAFGLVLMVALYWYLLQRLRKSRGSVGAGGSSRDLMSTETLFVLLLTQAVYILLWAPDVDQGIVLGLAVAAARNAARMPQPSGSPSQTEAGESAGDSDAEATTRPPAL